MTRRAATVAVCVLLVLAGCNTAGDPDGPELPRSTVTPAPVPTISSPTDQPAGTATASSPQFTARPTVVDPLAPGVNGSGVVAPRVLGREHDRALADTSFTRRTTLSIRYANGSVYAASNRTSWVEARGTRFRHVTELRGVWAERGGTRLAVFYGGNNVVQRLTTSNGTVVFPFISDGEGRQIRRSITDAEGEWLAALVADAVTRSVEPATLDGRAGYRVTLTDLRTEMLPVSHLVESPGNATLRAFVTTEGIVAASTVTYEATVEGRPVVVNETVRLSDIGSTTAEQPAWYPHDQRTTADGPAPTTGRSAGNETRTATGDAGGGPRTTATGR